MIIKFQKVHGNPILLPTFAFLYYWHKLVIIGTTATVLVEQPELHHYIPAVEFAMTKRNKTRARYENNHPAGTTAKTITVTAV